MGEGSAIGEGGDGSSVPADGGLSMAMSMDLFVSDSASNDDPSDAETSAHKTREELVNMKEEVFQKHRAGYTPVVHDIVIKTAKEFTSSSSSPGGEYQNAEQALNEIEKAYYGRDSTKAAELTKTLLEKRKDIRLRKSDHSEVNYLQKKLDSK